MVKQTVMTSVYGVTFVGARKQIQARLKERFQERNGGRMLNKEEEADVYQASRYIATVHFAFALLVLTGFVGRVTTTEEGRKRHAQPSIPSTPQLPQNR